MRLSFDFPLPPPWLRAVLVLVFLGVGVLIGALMSSPGGAQETSAGQPLRLVLPPAGEGAAHESSSATPPPISSETTPEAHTTTTSPTTTTAPSSKKPSGGGSAGSGGQGAGGQTAEGSAGGGGSSTGAAKLPPIKHVFLVVLADEPYATVFGPASKAPYIAQTLEKKGELLVRYYAVAHDELANEIALISGQGPTPETADNCPTYAALAPTSAGADEQVLGHGCVYPSSTQTLAGQLAAKHLTWRAYIEGMTGPGGAPAACAHPALGALDPSIGSSPAPSGPQPADQAPPADTAVAGVRYATFRNPFVYFDSVIDSAACAHDDGGLEQLHADLASVARTPNFSYIAPSLCDDGRPTPCADGQTGGLPAADTFLRKVIPAILASKAYKQSGLLVITVDQAPATGIEADSSSCCGQPRFPGLPAPAPLPGGEQLPPSGGGQIGALLLSPFVKAGGVDQDPYNHFALLRTIEDLFGLPHLGYAAGTGVKSFGATVFDRGG